MEAILGFLSSKLGLASLIGIPAAFLLLKKLAPKYAGKWIADLLGKGFGQMDKIEDPVEKQLIRDIALAVVRWAEYKIPDKGKGGERYAAAAAKLIGLLPFLKGRDADIAAIIEGAVAAMDEELKKTAER